MKYSIFVIVLAISVFGLMSVSANAADRATVFPPRNCTSAQLKIIAWQDGAETTFCVSGQDILHMALPVCEPGQVVTYHPDTSGRSLVGADAGGGNYFVCEDKEPVRKWQNLKAARTLQTKYVNSTTSDIEVSVSTYSGSTGIRCAVALWIDDVRVGYQFMNNNTGAAMCSVTATVPAGSTYHADNDGWKDISLYEWSELRPCVDQVR